LNSKQFNKVQIGHSFKINHLNIEVGIENKGTAVILHVFLTIIFPPFG